jgi:hypothetical protein
MIQTQILLTAKRFIVEVDEWGDRGVKKVVLLQFKS